MMRPRSVRVSNYNKPSSQKRFVSTSSISAAKVSRTPATRSTRITTVVKAQPAKRTFAGRPTKYSTSRAAEKTTTEKKETQAEKPEQKTQAEPAPPKSEQKVSSTRKEIPQSERLLDDELKPTPKLEKIAAQVFKKLDGDRDGVLNASEYAAYIKAAGRSDELVSEFLQNWSEAVEELNMIGVPTSKDGITQEGFLKILSDDIAMTPLDTRMALKKFSVDIPEDHLPYPEFIDDLSKPTSKNADAIAAEFEDAYYSNIALRALSDPTIDFKNWTESVAKLKQPAWVKSGKNGRFAHMLYDLARCDLNKEGLESTMAGVKRLKRVFEDWAKNDPDGYYLIEHSAEKVLPIPGTKINDTPAEFSYELADIWMTRASCGPAIRFFMSALVTDGSGGNLRRLPRIMEDALEIYNTEAGLVEGVVITASPMNQEEIDTLHDVIEQTMPRIKGKTLTSLINRVDPSILGGMKLYVGDVFLDASTARRTEQLRTQLQERISAATQERRKEFEKILQAHPGELTTWLGKQLGLI